MNTMNLYVYENRSMSNDLSRPLMLENLNVDNVQIHIPKEIDGTDMGTWAWWLVYQNAKREKYSIPMTLEGVTNSEGEEEYIATVGLNHGFTGKHGTVMYAIEAVQADGSGAVTHEWHTKTYKLEIVYTLQGNQTEYDESESDIISALISRVNELITSGAEIAEIAETIENAAQTAQEVIDSIPADYSSLSNRVGANTIALAEKADRSTTYTKTEVDALIDEVEVETDTTLEIAGAPADAAETGRQIGLIKADLGAYQVEGEITDFTFSQGGLNTTYGYDTASDTRCRTSVISFSGSKMTVTPKSGYKISGRIFLKASGASFDGFTDWTTEALEYSDSSKFYRIVIAKTDDSNITPALLPDDVITVKYYNSTDKSLSMDGKPADAGAVGEMKTAVDAQIDTLAQKIGFTAEKHIEKWTSGTINTNTGIPSDGGKSNRSYTPKMYFDETVDNKIIIHTSSDYGVSVRAYQRSDNSYMGMPFDGFVTGEYEFTANPEWYYRFVLARNDDADFAEANVTYMDAYFVFKTANEQYDLIKRNNVVETVALLQQLNRKTRTGHDAYGKVPLCFIHFSDVHGDSACLANIVKFKNTYADYISDILHTGDSVYYSSVDGMDFWNCIDGAENILNVIGNHDTKASKSGEWTGLSMAEAYTAYMAPYISNWECTYTADKTYYYKDYATEGVRLIVLDIMHQTAEQLSWFQSTLESARVAELDVVVAEHARAHWLFEANSSVWDDKVNVPEYSAGYSDTSSYTGSNYPSCLSDDYASAVDDFIDAGGYFICWLHGHTHFRILAHLQTHNRQLDVSVANTGRPGFAQTYVWERVLDTKSMDDFNVVAIDTTGKILRIAKIGVNTDRLMRVAHTMSYNYKTHTIINAS